MAPVRSRGAASHRREPPAARVSGCAIYTRKSSEQELEQDFNSLDAQREATEAYVKPQAHEGWKLPPTVYDDGGFSGGSMERPGLQRLLGDIGARRIDVVVVYEVDRLTRSLTDFAKLELFDANKVSFVGVTQQFNTTTSMGRLTLNMLLSFAQFEREVTAERVRDQAGGRDNATIGATGTGLMMDRGRAIGGMRTAMKPTITKPKIRSRRFTSSSPTCCSCWSRRT